MNTCQTSINTVVILFKCCCSPHPGSTRQTRNTTVVRNRTGQKGVVKPTNTGIPNTYHDETTETVIGSYR